MKPDIYRRGAHWAPVLLHALRRLICRFLCLQRAADGRPYEKAQSVWIAFRSTVGALIGRPFCSMRSAV